MEPPETSVPAMRPSSRHRWKRRADHVVVALSVVSGAALSAGAYWTLDQTGQLRARELSRAAADTVRDSLERERLHLVDAVSGTALMIESQDRLERDEFSTYASQLVSQVGAIASLEWRPVVAANDRAAFEAYARQQGLKSYQITDPSLYYGTTLGQGMLVPLLYAWPALPGMPGRDMKSSPILAETNLRAHAMEHPAASRVISLAAPDSLQPGATGFILSGAVYQPDPTAPGGRGLKGFVSATVLLSDLVKDAALRAAASRMDLLLYEVIEKGERRLIYASPDSDPDLKVGRPQVDGTQDLGQWNTFDMATQSWWIAVRPRPAFMAALPPTHAREALLSGLLMTLLLTLAILRAQSNRHGLEREQDETAAARNQLLAEQQRLQAVIEGAHLGTWEVHMPTGEMTVDQRWADISGYKLEDITPAVMKNWRQFCHPDDLEKMDRALKRHFTGKTPRYECEYRQRHKNNGWIWVSARAKVVKRSADGQPLLFAGTCLDISERKAVEAQILELNNTLEQRVQERTAQLESAMQTLSRSQDELARSEARATLGTLVASVSHELGTPLGNSMMAASTLQLQGQDFQKLMEGGQLRRTDLGDFVAQVNEGNRLILRNLERANELLKNFRQVAADQASEHRRSFDLKHAIREVVDTLAPSHKQQPHRVLLEVPEGIRMDSYPGPLGQVVINLINNAYLHAFDDTHAGTFTICGELLGDEVQLQFADDGRGIAPPTLAKMFEPFFSTRIGSGGTGLGMSIVDNLVRRTLGGTLSVQSTEGQGTRFDITLPLRAPMPTVAG